MVIFLLSFIFSVNSKADSTDVHIIIARLDYTSYDIKGYYEFSQPYELTDFSDPYTLIGNLYYYQAPAVDFGFTNVISALTGDTLFHASTVWAGTGHMVFPHDSLFITDYISTDPASPANALNHVLLFERTSEMADSAWTQIMATDFIHRIDSLGRYEVAVFDHFYTVGAGDPTTAEWIIVAHTNPVVTVIDTVPPAAPQNLTAAGFDDRVELKWDANPEPDLSHYVLYKDITSPPNDSIDTINKLDTTYLDIDVIYETTYYYRLIAVDSTGNKSEFSNEVNEITFTPPLAAFSPEAQQAGIVPLEVTFSDNSINDPTSWLWNFGDGAKSVLQNSSHTYTQTGIYTVSLQSSNVGGTDIEVKQALVWARAEQIMNLPAIVNLNVTPGNENAKTTRISGGEPEEFTGWAVSSGDIDGDGYFDVIIGDYSANPSGGVEAGATYIIYGSEKIESITTIDLDGLPSDVTRIYGDNAGDRSGWSVSSGDFNGDGYSDVIIGAYHANPMGRNIAGETYIIYGSSEIKSIASIDLDGTPPDVTRIYGENAHDYSGISVSSGDINGDGYSDVIIGAYQVGRGKTYIVYGSSEMKSIAGIDLIGTPPNVTQINGESGGDNFGWSVSNGDVNGDGFTDVIVGAPFADPIGGNGAGKTYIIYGSSGMESVASIDLDGTPSNVTRILGDDELDLSGYSVSSGDINGDGYAEVIIGAYLANPFDGLQTGETYIIYGSSGMEDVASIDLNDTPGNVTRIYGDDGEDRLGFSVSSGDINGDGYTDVIIGAKGSDPTGGNSAGETYIIYGSSEIKSIASIDLDGTPSNVTRILGDDPDDFLGYTVSSSDVNGDGYSDVIIGANGASTTGEGSTGETFVIYGGSERIGIIDEDILPTKFVLFQNYPNPFNPTTLIRYSLPKSSTVSLIIYNIMGQEVMRWDEQNTQPGYYSKIWNGTNKSGVPVGSGVYLYRLVAGDFVETRKMILLK